MGNRLVVARRRSDGGDRILVSIPCRCCQQERVRWEIRQLGILLGFRNKVKIKPS
jgi:hypothetical protein